MSAKEPTFGRSGKTTDGSPSGPPEGQDPTASSSGPGAGPQPAPDPLGTTEYLPPPPGGEETVVHDSDGGGQTRGQAGLSAGDRETAFDGTEAGGGFPSNWPGDRLPAPTPTVEQLRRTLVDLGLVPEAEFGRVAAGETDVAELARALVRAGKLTPYQAGAAVQGKSKGLAIGRYVILDRLGAGGMGVVFKARHRVTGRVVALKILKPSLTRSRDAVARFRREAEAAARLNHPNVVTVLDADVDRGVYFLVLDYVEGRDLDRLVRDRGPLPIDQALSALAQAARGLEEAHARGIVHRDIKPGNLMLDVGGTVKVLDLGLAKLIDAASHPASDPGTALTQAHTYMGTVDFMAPEQADDSRTADHRADIYSLGCTAYFLLTGRAPFEAPSVLSRLMEHRMQPAPSLLGRRPDVPPPLESLYQAMMAKRPEDRPASMAEVVARLDACLTTPAGAQGPPGVSAPGSAVVPPAKADPLASIELFDDWGLLPKPPARGARPGRLSARIAAGAMILAAAILGIGLLSGRGRTPPPGHADPAEPVAAGGSAETDSPAAAGVGSVEHGAPGGAVGGPPEPLVEVARLACDESRTVESVCVTPDGGTVISASANGTVQLWDPATGRELRRLWHPDTVRPVAVAPDGRRAFSGCEDGRVRVWDLRDGRLIRTIPAMRGRVLAVAVAPDGRTILAGGDGPELLILDAEDGVEVRRVACTPPVFSVAFTPDGRWLLAGGGDGAIVQVAADGRGDPGMLSTGSGDRGGGNAHAIWSIAVSDDGRRAVSAGGDGTAILWDLAERSEVRRVRPADGRLRSAAIEAGGRRAVLGLQFGNFSGGGALATWDLDSDAPPIVGQAIPAPLGLATLAGGEVASADADGSVRIRASSRSLHEARKLASEGREEASLSLYDEAVRSRPRDARLLIERGRLLARRGSTTAADADFARAAELSDNPQLFLDAGWWLSGLYPPWDRESSPELPAGLDPSRPPPPPVDGLGAPGWRPIATRGRGNVALGSVLGTVAPRSSLALTVVASASPRDVALLMRADDWGQLWVNGQRALSTAGGPCYSPWTEKLRLPAGKSTLVAGVVNEIGEHSVELRLSDDPAELGRSEMARGEWADAEAHFTAAIARSPSVPDTYRDRGDARAQMGRWRDADADFGQAGRIRPRAEAERIRSAYARLAADDLPGAREVCRELARDPAIGDDPAGARPLLTLLGATPDALEDYSAVLPVARRLALSNDDPGTSEILGALLSRAGEWEAALDPLKRSIDETGQHGGATAWARYALCLARLRRPGVREALRRAEELAPKELSDIRDASRRDSSLWVEAVSLEHLLKEARAALAPAP